MERGPATQRCRGRPASPRTVVPPIALSERTGRKLPDRPWVGGNRPTHYLHQAIDLQGASIGLDIRKCESPWLRPEDATPLMGRVNRSSRPPRSSTSGVCSTTDLRSSGQIAVGCRCRAVPLPLLVEVAKSAPSNIRTCHIESYLEFVWIHNSATAMFCEIIHTGVRIAREGCGRDRAALPRKAATPVPAWPV